MQGLKVNEAEGVKVNDSEGLKSVKCEHLYNYVNVLHSFHVIE